NYEGLIAGQQNVVTRTITFMLPLLPVFFAGALVSLQLTPVGRAVTKLGYCFLGLAAGVLWTTASMYTGLANLNLLVAGIAICCLLLRSWKKAPRPVTAGGTPAVTGEPSTCP